MVTLEAHVSADDHQCCQVYPFADSSRREVEVVLLEPGAVVFLVVRKSVNLAATMVLVVAPVG